MVSVCVPKVTSRRVVQEEDELVTSRHLVHETGQLLDKEQEQERVSMDFPGKAALSVEKELLVRECVAARAMDWSELHTRLDLTMPNDEQVTDSPIDLVIEVFKLKDKIKASLASHKLNWLFKDDGTKEMEKEEERAAKKLLGFQFDFDTAFDRCAKGMDDMAYQCMVDSACPNHTADCKSLEDSVKRRIDARDLVEHLRDMRSWYHDYGQDEANLWKEVERLDEALKDAKWKWTDNKHSCRKRIDAEVEAIKQRVIDELSAGEEQEDGACHEKADMMCPEGTYTTTQRRWNHVAGAGTFGTVYLIGKFTILPLGTMIGTAIAGPAGAFAGMVAANCLVFPLASATGYWASRGPMECACFPRECVYNNETETCALHAPDEEKATKNPWGDKIPMAGMKCAPRSQALWHGGRPSEEECDLQQCNHEDYTHTISGKTDIWGTAGSKGRGIYNCLTFSQSPAGMLAIAPTLPDGRPNTIEERNKIFTEVVQ
jgi:hypothetical protein